MTTPRVEQKVFHISDVLSISTGRLVSTRHMAGIYEILGWMTGESLMTHQLPRAMRECAPVLFGQYPALREVRLPDDPDCLGNIDKRHAWLTEQAKHLGSHMAIAPLPKRDPQYDTPVADAIEMVGDATKVIVVEP